jgi:hypothetical protein
MKIDPRLCSTIPRKNGGPCKPCVTGVPHQSEAERRTRTIIDHGWDAYAREEGHYDIPDNC